jgi:hypothetical protein
MTPKKPVRKPKSPIVPVAPVVVPQQPAVVTTTMVYGPNPIHRFVETFAFAGGVILLMLYMVVEILHAAGVRLGTGPTDEGFPWGTMISASLLVAPKMIGKATAGRAWNKIAGTPVSNTGEQSTRV